MGALDYKQFSTRHRPHIQPPDRVLFVTYRLAGSIPKATVREYKARKIWLANEIDRVRKTILGTDDPIRTNWLQRVEDFSREWFVKFENVLDKAACGPKWLKDERVAAVVAEGLQSLDGDAYRLDAYCVMSNHVHVVFKPSLTASEFREAFDEYGHVAFRCEHPGLSRIMHSLKGRSARECNRVLQRTGQFWEHESFDHVVREGRFYSAIRYTLNNPVKARLVENWRQWRWSYCRKELSDKL